jgi:O-methyltransferase involved in polyketide biosynthesis
VLLPLGYDPKQRSFFLLEGVVMYVVEAGNVATFEFIRENSAPGSVVVYDYLLKRVIQGDTKGLYAAAYLSFAVERQGSPTSSAGRRQKPPRGRRSAASGSSRTSVDKELGRRHLTGSNGKLDGRLLDWHRLMEVGALSR